MFTPRGKRFKPRKFWKLASQLIGDDDYEKPCRIRTSVGRAYYAAFLYVRGKLERMGYHFPDDHTVHQKVIDELKDRGNETMGDRLDRLLEKRRIADYYMDKPLSLSEGNYCTGISGWIIDNAEHLSTRKK